MEQTAEERLTTRLGMDQEALAPFTAVLDESQLAALDAVVAAALEAEDVAIQRSIEEALETIPRPVRPAARAILMGDS